MGMGMGIAVCVAAAAAGAFWYFKSHNSNQSRITDEAGGEAVQDELSPEKRKLYDMAFSSEHLPNTFLYALTTCRHCKKTKEFLDANNIPYTIIYVDEFEGDRRKELMDKVREYNPRGSFPTIRLTDGRIIVGYRENLLREALLS